MHVVVHLRSDLPDWECFNSMAYLEAFVPYRITGASTVSMVLFDRAAWWKNLQRREKVEKSDVHHLFIGTACVALGNQAVFVSSDACRFW